MVNNATALLLQRPVRSFFSAVSQTVLRAFILTLAAGISLDVLADNDASLSLSGLDWVPREQLTAEQLENCPIACAGAYIAPVRTDADALSPPADSPIRGEADFSEFNTDAVTAVMEGDVVFTQGWRELQSDRVEIDRSQGILKLDGDVSIREPGILLVGESAYINSSTNQIEVKDAQYLFHEQRIRGSASDINRSAPSEGTEAASLIRIHDASYTSCEPGDETWVLYADKIQINEDSGRASARGVRIETSGVPVFYAPYFQFIVDDRRATGLLYPTIGYSDDEGFEYSQPFYLNISPTQDLTLTPRITTRRSSGLEAEHRLLSRNSFTRSSGAFYPDDDLNPEHSNERWSAAVTHRSRNEKIWGQWAAQINFARISDDDFLEDWDTDVIQTDERDIHLRQHAAIAIELDHWRFNVSATDYQNLLNNNADQYRELPKIDLNGHYELADDLQLELNQQWARFDRSRNPARDDLLSPATLGAITDHLPLESQISEEGAWVTGERLRASWSMSWNKQASWGYIQPRFAMNYLAYDLDAPVLGASDDSPDTLAPEISVDAGLNFERQTSLFGKAGLQSLEPRIYYLLRDSESQTDMPVFDTAMATESLEQLFRDSSFVGGDRLEDASQLTLGLWSRFYSTESNREILSLGVGQSYYLRDRKTFLGDAILTGGSNSPGNGLSIGSSLPLTASAMAVLISDATDRLNQQQRDRSDIVTEAVWHLSPSMTLRGSAFWNDQQSELERSRLEFSYRPHSTNHFLKLGYIQESNHLTLRDSNGNDLFESSELINEDIEQIAISGQWSLDERWNLLFLWREDLENSRSLDKIAGVSYQSCCWNLSLSWRSELTRVDTGGLITEAPRKDSGIILHFEFSGLGGLGTPGRKLIENW